MKSLLRFLRNWTLPVSIASGIAIYLVFALVPALDGAARVCGPICDRILPLFMFLILFVTFCKVDFRRLIPVRWMLWVGVVQVLFVALLIPVCFPLIDKAANVSFLTAFLTILHEVCMVLVLPMLLAYIVKHGMKRLHRWVVSINDLSYYMWGGSLLIVSGTTAKNIAHADTSLTFLLIIALLGLVLCVIQFAVGRFIGHYFGATTESGQALGQKNTAFAIWIAYTYLNPLSSIGPGCYILWQNIINSVEIWLCRRRLGHELHT